MRTRYSFVRIFLVAGFMAVSLLSALPAFADSDSDIKSVRKERNYIRNGNRLYDDGKYRDAVKCYEQALEINPSSAVGRFNLGLSQIRIGNVADTTKASQEILRKGIENLQACAAIGARHVKVASLANYNLGNIAFNKQDYASAIQSYKQALRLNPDDGNARRNLRIAQLKKQEQDQNKQNQDKKDQNKDQDKQDQKQDQNKNQNKQDQNNQDKDKQNPPKQDEQDMSSQTADRILQAMENKEQQTRQKVMRGKGSENGEKAAGGSGGRFKW